MLRTFIASLTLPGSDLFWGFIGPYAVGMLVALFGVPLMRAIAVRRRLYDRPDSGLKPHERPIPYLGGVGIWLGWLAVVVLHMTVEQAGRGPLAWVLLGGTVLMLVGLLDDLRNLSPKLRLVVQAVVALLLVYGGPGRGAWSALVQPVAAELPGWLAGEWVGWCFDAVFCILLLIGASNSTNLIDGLDGLCGGVVGIACLAFWTLTLLLWHVGGGQEMDPGLRLRIVLCAAVVGAGSAFLAFNFHPATIFMGDSGSLLLGFNVAVLIALVTRQGGWRGLVGGLLVFGLPILDTSLAVARRWLNGRPLFVGDRSHLYDQLRDRGFSVPKTVYICYLLGVVFGALGCACAVLPRSAVVAVAIAAPIVAAVVCRRSGLLRVDDAAQRSHQSSQGENAETLPARRDRNAEIDKSKSQKVKKSDGGGS